MSVRKAEGERRSLGRDAVFDEGPVAGSARALPIRYLKRSRTTDIGVPADVDRTNERPAMIGHASARSDAISEVALTQYQR